VRNTLESASKMTAGCRKRGQV